MRRTADFLVSVIALAMVFPMMLVIGLTVLIADGHPVIFYQARIGRGGAPFRMAKFRTMREVFDQTGAPLPDDLRITPLGRWLRRYRLDELPGLLPIIKGEMSLVGPRPLPASVLEGMPVAPERMLVRPGLTGLAQVSGNTLLTNEEKVALDVHYVCSRSFHLDISILFRTLLTVFAGERRDEKAIHDALTNLRSRSGEQDLAYGGGVS